MADNASKSTAGLSLSVVTPEETVLETAVDSLVLPLVDGEIGILRGHAPMIGRLGFGEMRLTAGGQTTKYYVDGGFVQVVANTVSILTPRAFDPAKLDGEAAKQQLAEALTRNAPTPAAMAARDRALDQARAQVRLAAK
ncbi:MAG: ATP synthase F1 subunit epsilon [Lacipirellulaceae bacterium]